MSVLLIPVHEIFVIYPFQFSEIVNEWILISISILLLIVLLITIRNLKPEIIRYPYPLVYVPLLVLAAYPSLQGTPALTNIIFMMLQGAGLLVISILFVGHSESIEHPKYAIIGVCSLFTAYGMYWIAGDFYELSSWSWEVLIAVGMISLPISFVGFIKNTHT
ncbi:MAG: hypothetical protein WD008_02360 [Balneolaceae bacterium]